MTRNNDRFPQIANRSNNPEVAPAYVFLQRTSQGTAADWAGHRRHHLALLLGTVFVAENPLHLRRQFLVAGGGAAGILVKGQNPGGGCIVAEGEGLPPAPERAPEPARAVNRARRETLTMTWMS